MFSAKGIFQFLDILLYSLQNFVDLGARCQDFQGHPHSLLVVENNRDVHNKCNKSDEEKGRVITSKPTCRW